MPSIKISSDLQLFYSSNAPNDDVSKFDHSKATILFFHPLFLDSTWLRPQFQDARLNAHYNLIAFDARSSGRTKSKYTPLRDAWVEAADVGVAMELLGIPRCHVYAIQMNSCHAAYRFALLFPQKVLSLCLCQLGATVDFDWTNQAYFELLESWCFPSDLETIERACVELGYLMFNHGIMPVELADEVYAWWQTHFPATKRTKFLENALTCVSRQTLTDDQMNRLQMPVLVMHGDQLVVNPVEQAEAEAARIPNAQFFIVKGGPEAFAMVPSSASIANRVYTSFLSRIPTPPPSPPMKIRKEKAILSEALETLADIFGDPSIAKRKPTSVSFSMNSPERNEENAKYFAQFEKGEKKALTALGKDGLPTRKVSSRNDDQWSDAALNRKDTKPVIVMAS
ncbi:alpha/beta-hydrolase [Ramaria rubella]|nr:alpha/beta-hydrolase [Ramaria rubella]